MRGDIGAPGATGPAGAASQDGVDGIDGTDGLIGPAGADGADGATGPAGADGADGATGPAGADGADGATGPAGADGSDGATGPAGADGTSVVPEYAYIYNEGAQTVPVEDTVEFDTNGLSTSGISHAPGDNAIVVYNPGIYKVTYIVTAVEANQFAVFVNGALAPGAVLGAGGGARQNTGQMLLQFLAGDVISLVNHSSAAAVDLQIPAGGTQSNVNASILIERLG